jgi:hypothetical protein
LRATTHPLDRRDQLAGRRVPLQRGGRPPDGAGQRGPQGDRLRAGRR